MLFAKCCPPKLCFKFTDFTDRPYDYIIMDEASQVSIETEVLALTCAYNAVIVGDLLQLPNVVR